MSVKCNITDQFQTVTSFDIKQIITCPKNLNNGKGKYDHLIMILRVLIICLQ